MVINVKVTPKSKKVNIEEIIDMFGNNVLHVRLISAPEDNKANLELMSILAEHFNTKKQNINIIRGRTSRNKIVEILV
jgi:uncharacterized protein (TIGR00251 family)